MNKKTRSFIKGFSVLLVLLAVLMEMRIATVDALAPYRFWMAVIGFGLTLVTSR